MKFKCDSCGNELSQDISCHGHTIGYRDDYLVCVDCGNKELTDKEVDECLPRCCDRPMSLKKH